jgi:hypothetical protein
MHSIMGGEPHNECPLLLVLRMTICGSAPAQGCAERNWPKICPREPIPAVRLGKAHFSLLLDPAGLFHWLAPPGGRLPDRGNGKV